MTTQMMPQRTETLAESVSRRVRGLMGERRVSGVKLAEQLGMTQQTLSRRTTGLVEFRLSEIEVLADTLGVSPAYLLGYAIPDSNREPADLVGERRRHRTRLSLIDGGQGPTVPPPAAPLRGYVWRPRLVEDVAS